MSNQQQRGSGGFLQGIGIGAGIPAGCILGCLGLVLGLIFLAAVVSTCAGPGKESPTLPTGVQNPADHPVAPNAQTRQPSSEAEDEGTITVAYKAASAEGYQSNEFIRPSSGNTFAVVWVVITNSSRKTMPVNPMYFQLGVDGVWYNVGMVPVSRDLPCCDLGPGARVSGYVGFEVPRSALQSSCSLKFEPMTFESYPIRYEIINSP